MKNVRLAHSIRQMFLALAGFVVVIAVIESDGLANWADRLEPGVLRAIAAPATSAVQKTLHPFGVSTLRDHALREAAHLGWTDDAALLAEGSKPAGAPSSSPPVGHEVEACALSSAGGAAKTPVIATAAALAPLAASVPRTSSLAALAPVEQGKTRVVALAGDSMMAVGLSATLMREAADDKNLHLVKAFRSGTGLARPEVFDWMSEYPAMVGMEKPDVVIVAIGANDGQGFVVDGKVQAFGSEEWRKTYQERVANYLAMVESTGARIVWVGLPPMRSPAFNEKIATINRIDYTVVAQDPHATWWNPAPYVADEAGGFREFAAHGNGKMMRLRAPDGIHFSDEGADLLTSVLIKWLDPPVETVSTVPALVPGLIAASNREPLRR